MEQQLMAVKSNCAKGYSLASHWSSCYEKSIRLLLESWKLMEHDDVEILFWDAVEITPVYKTVDSSVMGIYSVIGLMVIPEKTYTNKKGITKTTPLESVPSHYTQDGEFIGRVSVLGEKPISYPMGLRITSKQFKFVKVGTTLEDCVELKEVVEPGEVKRVPNAVLKGKK